MTRPVTVILHVIYSQRKLRSVQKSVEPNPLAQQPSLDEKHEEESNQASSTNSQTNSQTTSQTNSQTNSQVNSQANIQVSSQAAEATPQAETEPAKTPSGDAFRDSKHSPAAVEPTFPAEFEDNFGFQSPRAEPREPHTPEPEKPKLTEKELKVLRLELENAEYLQLKSLLQAKINSEQFEIVKLRSHVALKSKKEAPQAKEQKELSAAEEHELRQRLMKENAMLEQKRLSLVNQIFQERVACVQLKIELAMKEILSKS